MRCKSSLCNSLLKSRSRHLIFLISFTLPGQQKHCYRWESEHFETSLIRNNLLAISSIRFFPGVMMRSFLFGFRTPWNGKWKTDVLSSPLCSATRWKLSHQEQANYQNLKRISRSHNHVYMSHRRFFKNCLSKLIQELITSASGGQSNNNQPDTSQNLTRRSTINMTTPFGKI